MKTLFKTILLIAALLQTASVCAQQSPLQLGVKAGVNLSGMTGDFEDTSMRFGYQFGVTLDYALTSNFYLQSGLSFMTKGVKEESSQTNVDGDYVEMYVAEGTIKALYLQVPIMAAYKIDLSKSLRIAFKAGPYLAYGIGGKTKATLVEARLFRPGSGTWIGETPDDEYVRSSSGKADTFSSQLLKSFDLGLGVGIDVEIWKAVVGIGFDAGLLDIGRGDNSIKNQNLYLTVGYRF